MPTHTWRVSALGSTPAHGEADSGRAALTHALDAAEDLVRAGHVEQLGVVVDDLPAAQIAPARTTDDQPAISDTLATLAGLRQDLQLDSR